VYANMWVGIGVRDVCTRSSIFPPVWFCGWMAGVLSS